jgi:hypothetical protein
MIGDSSTPNFVTMVTCKNEGLAKIIKMINHTNQLTFSLGIIEPQSQIKVLPIATSEPCTQPI